MPRAFGLRVVVRGGMGFMLDLDGIGGMQADNTIGDIDRDVARGASARSHRRFFAGQSLDLDFAGTRFGSDDCL